MPGTLYLVATPIGNLEDITLRAIEVLKEADVIACEDTRRTGKLLHYFGIETSMISCHDHNEAERAPEIAVMLRSGKNVALVSDAGSPAVADPGYRVVRAAIDSGARVESVPGPSSVIAAVSVSGLPTDSFFFGGFLPSRKGERIRRLRECASIPATLVFLETPHRLPASLADCLDVLGDRPASVSRELTKIHEETIRGRLSEFGDQIRNTPPRGEFVIVIDRAAPEAQEPAETDVLAKRYQSLLSEGEDPKKALKRVSKEFGIPRDEAYRRIHLEGE